MYTIADLVLQGRNESDAERVAVGVVVSVASAIMGIEQSSRRAIVIVAAPDEPLISR